ncbi:hypothetical protein D0Z07_4799 [Hyphodiscus hymeniophilus]|uniref:Transcription initiation factor TFIID subunit 4 n=1 Tax=Hyphodiscus hymeniophilus TaxID=353542 RepID=A0A9P7AXD5_9HELO|nr:hypothetical protein D0Z07_4799 [Hyphodiscus hymeniophilus]
MAQPGHQQFQNGPARPFSPPQASPSPALPHFTLPPNKRQRMSPGPPSQPTSPYVQSPYGVSPGASTPQSAGASPHFANVQLPQGVYSTPYASSNGPTTPTLNLPQANNHNGPQYQNTQNHMSFPTPPPNYNQNNQQPTPNYMMPPQGAGTMGPPSKPAEKVKEDGIDPMDVLGGTGIDLREEEQYTFQLYNKSFNSQISGSQSGTISSGNSFTQFPPGPEGSFYGAGPANTTAEIPNTKSQKEYFAQSADRIWTDSARDLAISRQRELNHPFLNIQNMTRKMRKISQEHVIHLMEVHGDMGTMKLPDAFPTQSVTVKAAVGPNGAMVSTGGSFLPYDSLLVDQVALISIATKHRLRALIEDAARLAKGRQITSHGVVPADWADVAAPTKNTGGIVSAAEATARSGVEPNTLKRSLSSANMTTPIVKFSNEVVAALRGEALKEREFEEARLRKRRARLEGGGASRAGSVIPGTPGSIAPDPMEKAPTKKAQKKADMKKNEADNHAGANNTAAQFLGGGGGLFGKKKKYSWMTGSAVATATPAQILNTPTQPGTPTGKAGPPEPEKLTSDGVRRLGTWREDKEKGRGIQIRDWLVVLEGDGREKKALQRIYATLDDSQPK